MHKQNGMGAIAVILVVIIALLLGALGGYYYFKNKDGKSTNSTVTTTPTTTSSTSSSETASWKTYTNSTYGYAIKYPSDWAYREYPDTKSGAGFRLASTTSDPANELITIDLNARPAAQKTQSFAEYVKTAASASIQGYGDLVSNAPIKTTSGLTGYETTWKVTSMTTQKTETSLPITYFDSKDSNNDTINVTLVDSKYLDTYNKMLPTFQLTK
ncbi:MAG: hypothetical protein M1338_00530 [Patescibacteria group bacterium]|nr:hypothetical protein [Patescibacteria group bacterium]